MRRNNGIRQEMQGPDHVGFLSHGKEFGFYYKHNRKPLKTFKKERDLIWSRFSNHFLPGMVGSQLFHVIKQIRKVTVKSNLVSTTSLRKTSFHSFIQNYLLSICYLPRTMPGVRGIQVLIKRRLCGRLAWKNSIESNTRWGWDLRWETARFSFFENVVRPSGFYRNQEGTPSFSWSQEVG